MKRTISAIFAVSILMFVSCKKEKPAVEDPAKITVVTFTIGDVKIVSGTAEKNAGTGDRVPDGAVLKTGKNSFAVIQAGTDSIVRIQQESEFRPDKVSDNEKSLSLVKGEVFCKVNKMSKSQEFKISSPTIAAAVRGTQFSLTCRDKKNTVAVSDGKVAVIPSDDKKDFSNAVITEPGFTAFLKEEKGKPSAIAVMKSLKEDDDMLKDFSDTPVIPDVDKKTPDEIKNIMSGFFSTGNAGKDQKQKDIIKKQSASLKEIKDAFERIDEISLYSKQVIRGIILTHGASYVVITPAGKKIIPRSDIKNVTVIK